MQSRRIPPYHRIRPEYDPYGTTTNPNATGPKDVHDVITIENLANTYRVSVMGKTLDNIVFLSQPVKDPKTDINGITNEVLLAIIKDRLTQFQAGPLACPENYAALLFVDLSLKLLQDRTTRRLKQGLVGINAEVATDNTRAAIMDTICKHGKALMEALYPTFDTACIGPALAEARKNSILDRIIKPDAGADSKPMSVNEEVGITEELIRHDEAESLQDIAQRLNNHKKKAKQVMEEDINAVVKGSIQAAIADVKESKLTPKSIKGAETPEHTLNSSAGYVHAQPRVQYLRGVHQHALEIGHRVIPGPTLSTWTGWAAVEKAVKELISQPGALPLTENEMEIIKSCCPSRASVNGFTEFQQAYRQMVPVR